MLSAPSDLQVTDTKKNAVRVSWSDDNRGMDHVRYRVYRNGVLQFTTDENDATVAGLECATSYAIGVASVDGAAHTSATSTVITGTESCTGGLRIVLSAPQYVGRGTLLRADTNGDAKSVSFGYCPGATCSWSSATTIGTLRNDDDTRLLWGTLPRDGRYTLLAHAVDQRGRSVDSAPLTVTVDGTSPRTTITSGPAPFVNTTSASFTFGASEPVSGFECSLDGSRFATCDTTLALTGLVVGAHTLSVRSTDLAGNVDPTPPSLTWTIDRTAPKTTIVSGPPTRTTSTTASFSLSATEPATFECSLDGGSFTVCTAAPVLTSLGVGLHRFVARATDRAGNADPSPPAWSWTIDPPAGPVQVTITSAPSGTVASRAATISFSSNYSAATFECALDASAFAVCANPAALTSLSDGPHSFRVRAVAIDGTRSTPASASWIVDGTGPVVTLASSRPPESSGWYRSSVTFTTSGTDAGGVVSCTPVQTYNGPDASHVTITGSCVDAVGNAGTTSVVIAYDATSPSVTLSPARGADSNGWYNHPLSFAATASDATSGSPVCAGPAPYAGPDGAHVSASVTCTDAAGNVGTAGLSFAYDATAPAAVAAPSRSPDHGPWYSAPFSVSFSGTDTISGGVHCDAPLTFGGPDGSALSISGSCSDTAGNTSAATFAFKYDATAPTVTASPDRAADRSGWFNHAVTISFTGADSTSGGVTCDAPKTYSAPDSASASRSGSCTDAAGNVASASFSFKYDATAPTASASPDRPADHNGWYNHPLTISFGGSDASSGGVVCDPAVGYHTDSAAALVAGSCVDAAGNVATGTFGFSYDATAPSATASTDRAADHNGWFNHPVTVSFAGADALSGVTCDPAVSYHADSAAANVSGSCSDGAGNTASASAALKYDATSPSATASVSRPADANGWYNHPLSVSFNGVDALSGDVVCDAPVGYGADAAAASVGGSCVDAAGNSANVALSLRYDSTAPSVTATPSRPTDANGWYNHPLQVSFAGSDALSGGVHCDSPVTYGTDAAAVTITGSCTDAAGNTGTSPFALEYDGSAPHVTAAADRAPDHNGWYTHPVSVSFSAADDLSGGVVCAPAVHYATDDGAASLSGSCIDAAGNQASASLSLKYDATAPVVTASPDRSPDRNGWFNHPVSISFAGSDALSGGVSCDPAVGYSTDSAAAHVAGSCTDAAGNTGSDSLSLKYDATAPLVTAAPDRSPDSNGWFNHPLSISFSGSDALSGGVSCDPAVSYSTDAAAAHVAGSCTDAAGNTGSGSLSLKYDSTAPLVTAAPDRSPDSNGWYNHPLSVSFSGDDALSGSVTCEPSIDYSTDSASASVTGSCTDAAGNTGSAALPVMYDSTAPDVLASPDRTPDHNGWYNHAVVVSYLGTDGTSGIGSCTLPETYFAPDSSAAVATGSCTDAAGNSSTGTVDLRYDATPPAVTALASRAPDSNGWYNHAVSVVLDGTDETSGGVVCDAPVSYGGPDDLTAAISGACSDAAGNSAVAGLSLSYDATAPSASVVLSRPADHNGWYNRPLDVSVIGADSVSGGVLCTATGSYAGPDNSSALVGGSCTDAAGNTAGATSGLSYDATAPLVHATPSRQPNVNGWYNAALEISFSGSDATSGLESCAAPASYDGPDASAASVTGTCTDLAGNSGAGSLDLRYDSTAPTVDAAPDRAPDSHDWFNHALSIAFTGSDSLSGGVLCDPAVTYSGPDTAHGVATGVCTDAAGNVANASYPFEFDATAPSVVLAASRQPDSGGFYNHPVTFTATAVDGMSQGTVCSGPISYTGPDSTAASVTASCTDAAGNTGTGSASLKYDTASPDTTINNTPPSLTNVSSTSFTFSSTEAGSTFVCTVDGTPSVCSSPFSVTATDGNHTFTVAATDAAGNTDASPAQYSWAVDTVPPDTSFTSTPDPITNQASAFALASPDATATFQCSLDGTAFTACAANVSVGTPADGSHTFRARAVDPAGNVDASPATYTWTTDTQAPTVTYTASPAAVTNVVTATFTWTTNELASFVCRLDNVVITCGTTTSTGGTRTVTGLNQGAHSFSVRATDPAGNRMTQVVSWTVDTGPPDTDLQLPLPANPTSSRAASFTFTATEPGSGFRCKLDAAAFAGCNNGTISYSGLADGSHTFSVAAIDPAGNLDPTPATWTWIVDATPPTGALTAPAAGATVSGSSVTLSATATDNVSVLGVQFELDGAALGAEVVTGPTYSITWDTTVTADGPHTLTALVRDEVGNVTTTAPVQVTVSNAGPPPPAGTVDVGPGFVDASTRQVLRTSAGRVYVIAADDTAAVGNPVHAATGQGVIRAYKGNQNGTPTAFAEVDAANHPASGGSSKTALSGVDARLGSDGIARTVFSDNSFGTALLFKTFSTTTDTWGATETIDTGVGTFGRGRIAYALALDATDVPHVVYAKAGTLYYVNRVGGTWSVPVALATGTVLHPMLAFDAAGMLHLAWLNDVSGAPAIMYANRSAAGAWSAPETVAGSDVLSNSNADQGPSIAVDSANHPYVLYVSASKGTFGPAGDTAQYGAIRIKERVGGTWTSNDPTPDVLTHTPQIYMHGDDLYAFNGHDTAINFAYSYRLAGLAWTPEQDLTTLVADGSANIRWDPLHENDPSIIDAAFYNEDRLGNRSFLGEIYYRAVAPSTAPAADTTPPSVAITSPAGGIVSGTVSLTAGASDNVGVASIQFELDGSALGGLLTSAPYSYSWSTTSVANGTHNLIATAKDAAGNTTDSATVTVDVENAVAPPPAPTTLFGDTTLLSHSDNNVAGDVEAFAITASASGSLAHLSVYLDSPVPSSLVVGLYSDSGTVPAMLLGSTSLSTLATGWNTVDLGPLALTAGAQYWVTLLVPSGASGVVSFRDGRTGPSVWYGGHGLTALPAAWPGGSAATDGPVSSYGTT